MIEVQKYWENKELEFIEYRKKCLEGISIEWLDRKYFWSSVDRGNETPFTAVASVSAKLDELRERIDVAPVFRPVEEDFPGPVERWYGVLSGNFFLFTFYYGDNSEDCLVTASEAGLAGIVEELNMLLAIRF